MFISIEIDFNQPELYEYNVFNKYNYYDLYSSLIFFIKNEW